MKKILGLIEENVSIVVFLVMLIITFAYVIGRYVFHASISFTDEITTNLFVLVSVIGTAIAARDRAHLGLSAFTELLPKRTQHIVSGVGNFLGAIYGVVLLVTGIQMVMNQIAINSRSTTLMIPAWIYGIFLPIGALFIIYQFARMGLEDFSLARKEKEN